MADVRKLFQAMDPTLADGPRSLKQLMLWHNIGPGEPMGLARIVNRHRPDRSVALRFLSYNTYLLRLTLDLPIVGKHDLTAKPETEARSTEIGQRLSSQRYDLACLYEVFQESEQQRVIAGMSSPPLANIFGGWASSLLFISKASPVVRSAVHVFSQRGKTYKVDLGVESFEVSADSDWYARKGVLMVEIDTGLRYPGDASPVAIEIYATHMVWGGGLPSAVTDALTALTFGDDIAPLTPKERFDLQMAQVDEFVAFYSANHRARNVAILCGDFNIDGSNPALYGPLLDRLRPLNLVDAWADGRYPAEIRAGQTARNDDGDGPREADFSNVCVPLPGPGGADYCDESANLVSAVPGGRLDYIFVEQPAAIHRCRVDFGRVRRRQFRRATPTGDQRFLSDHLGLETTLFVSLKFLDA
jgi:endonuclease/exonuclease/phosphatase family metal-dependent hydrolase